MMEATVINKARELFFTYGLKSISMDDLAKKAGVSKKTIYQAITDKNELVGRVVEELLQCHAKAVKQSSQEAKDAIEENLNRICLPFETLASININFFFDLEKFFPTEWKKVMDYKYKNMLPAIIKNLKRGMAEGLYNEELDISFVAAIRLQQIATALNPSDFQDKRQDPQQLMNDLTIFYLQSITTTKGKRLLNKYISRNNESKRKP
jgi:AcrR family transcriptional regulator